jgi:hypothetical protein
MANTLYHKLGDGSWINISNGGGPSLFQVQVNAADGLFYPTFTYNEQHWHFVGTGSGTVAAAQTQLDTFIGNLNAGTIGP